MPSDNEFDYMSDSFLAEWLVLYDISHHVYVKFCISFVNTEKKKKLMGCKVYTYLYNVMSYYKTLTYGSMKAKGFNCVSNLT